MSETANRSLVLPAMSREALEDYAAATAEERDYLILRVDELIKIRFQASRATERLCDVFRLPANCNDIGDAAARVCAVSTIIRL